MGKGKKLFILIAIFVASIILVYAFTLAYPDMEFIRTEGIQPVVSPVFSENANDTEITLRVGSPFITINKHERSIDERGTVPVIQNDRILLPIRAVLEAMGGTVNWDDETRTVMLSHRENLIKLTIGSNTAYLNGIAHTLDVAPVIINDSTLLPIRFIAESLGFKVDWDDVRETVIITDPQEEANAGTLETSNAAPAVWLSANKKLLTNSNAKVYTLYR